MAALNFMKTFAPLIRARTKPHTIRAPRKVPIKVGETLYLYTGLRTSNTCKLGEAKCLTIAKLIVYPDARTVTICAYAGYDLTLAYPAHLPNRLGPLDPRAVDDLARADGFATTDAFFDFFRGRTDADGQFEGSLFYWGDTLKLKSQGGAS